MAAPIWEASVKSMSEVRLTWAYALARRALKVYQASCRHISRRVASALLQPFAPNDREVSLSRRGHPWSSVGAKRSAEVRSNWPEMRISRSGKRSICTVEAVRTVPANSIAIR